MKNTRKNLLKKRKHMSKKHHNVKKYNVSKKNRLYRKHLSKKHKTRKYKGGYGLGANPFPRHPGAWNVDNMGNYFLFNPHGQVTGSPDPFFGKTAPQPQMTYSAFKSGLTPYQKGGMLGQGLVNLYRNGMNSVVNNAPFLGRVYRGKHPIVSPSPTVQPAMRTKTIIPGPLPNIKEIRYNSKTLASKY